MTAKTVFYARVSSRDQRLDSQVAAARQLGVRDEHIFVEKASGVRRDRPQLAAALASLEPGDTLACFKLDRIGRSLSHLTGLLDELDKRGIYFRTADGQVNTNGSTGKLLLHILGAVAQFERDLILERTLAGLAISKAQGRVPGPKRKLGPQEVASAKKLLSERGLKVREAAAILGVGERTLFRELKANREREELKSI